MRRTEAEIKAELLADAQAAIEAVAVIVENEPTSSRVGSILAELLPVLEETHAAPSQSA